MDSDQIAPELLFNIVVSNHEPTCMQFFLYNENVVIGKHQEQILSKSTITLLGPHWHTNESVIQHEFSTKHPL
jgi:hypothetical protein